MSSPSEQKAERRNSLENAPNLLMGTMSLFLLLFIIGVTYFPSQTYVEYAPRWQLLLGLLAAIGVGAVAMQDAPSERNSRALAGIAPLIPLVALGWLAYLATMTGEYAWAGTDWLATLLQGAYAAAIGWALGRHFELRGPHGRRRLIAAIAGIAALLAIYYVIDGFHQYIVRFPQKAAYLRTFGTGSEIEALMIDAMERGRVSSRLGNPNVLAAALCLLWPLIALSWATARPNSPNGAAARFFLAILAVGAMPAVLVFTGSRGGVLTAIGTVALSLVFWRKLFFTRRTAVEAAIGAVVGAALFLAISAAGQQGRAAGSNVGPEDGASRFKRPSTIVMRLGFLQAGVAMLPDYGMRGAGAGAYEHLSLHYQVPGRQESKFAHNWPLQVAVEAGILGLALTSAIFILAIVLWWRRRGGEASRDAGDNDELPDGSEKSADDSEGAAGAWNVAALENLFPGALLLTVIVFAANGLVEITFYQRELFLIAMGAFGLLAAWPESAARDPKPGKNASNRILTALLALAVLTLTFPIQNRLTAQGALTAAREGAMAKLSETLGADRPLSDAGDILEVVEAAREADRRFEASPEAPLLLADLGMMLGEALRRGRVAPELRDSAAALAGNTEANVAIASQRAPRSAALWARLAMLQSNPVRAIELMDRAVKLHPAKPDYRHRLALLWLDRADAIANDADLEPEAIENSVQEIEARARDLLEKAIELDYRKDRIEIYEQALREIGTE